MVDRKKVMSFSGKPLIASAKLIYSSALAYCEFDNNFFRIVTALPKNASEDDRKVNSNYMKRSFGTKVSVEYPHHDFAQLNDSR
jgi:hypothetical protein